MTSAGNLFVLALTASIGCSLASVVGPLPPLPPLPFFPIPIGEPSASDNATAVVPAGTCPADGDDHICRTFCAIKFSHTLCIFTGVDKSKCGDVAFNSIPATMSIAILDHINTLANTLAGGTVTGLNGDKFPIATNMALLVWDDSLARSAQMWADQCHESEHDENRDSVFGPVGQLVGNTVSSGSPVTVTSVLKDITTIIDSWNAQAANFPPSNVASYSTTTPTKTTGVTEDFTQLFWAASTAIGCGVNVNTPNSSSTTTVTFVCNIRPKGDIDGEPMYIAGTKAASNCANGPSTYKNAQGVVLSNLCY